MLKKIAMKKTKIKEKKNKRNRDREQITSVILVIKQERISFFSCLLDPPIGKMADHNFTFFSFRTLLSSLIETNL